jgi:hypothetical protein
MELKGLYYKLVMSQEDKEEITSNTEAFLQEEKEIQVQISATSLPIHEGGDDHNETSIRTRLISEASLEETIKPEWDKVEVIYYIIETLIFYYKSSIFR